MGNAAAAKMEPRGPDLGGRRQLKYTYSLQELFDGRIFRVPDYQRGYAWEQRQVSEFLEDLELLNDSRPHYTGTVVLHKSRESAKRSDDEGTSYAQFQIVDGQQRLTTAVVLINEVAAALRRIKRLPNLSAGLKKRYVAATGIDGLPLYKLSLGQDTNDYFKTNILPDCPRDLGSPETASARRLLEAKEHIAGYLKDAGDGDDAADWLQRLIDKVTDRLQFSLYEVDHEAEVGVIFEVMNDRGIPLSELEKVKNHLLYSASTLSVGRDGRSELARQVNEAWAVILRRMANADLGTPAYENQLLRAHWLTAYDPSARRWHGNRSLRARFDLRTLDHRELLGQLVKYVAGLRRSTVPFCDIVRPARHDSFGEFNARDRERLRLWSEKLARIGYTATFLPLLMVIRTRWPRDAGKYLDALELCEKLAFRTYRIARYYSTFGQPAMIRLAYRIAREDLEFPKAMDEIRELYGGRHPREAFERFVDSESGGGWFGRGGLSYFLYEYECHLAGRYGGSPEVPFVAIEKADSLEHILPQYMGKHEYWLSRFSPEEHEKYLEDLGNLTLTKGNSSLSNKPYPLKKGSPASTRYCYDQSVLQVERELADSWPDWTPESIVQRRSRLLDWARTRWHVNF